MKRDLVVFGEDWGGLPTSTQYLVQQLAADRRIVWVNSIGMRRPRLSRHDVERLWRKGQRAIRRRNASEGPSAPFPVVFPRAVPLPGNPLARWVNRRVLARQVARAVADAGIGAPVLWTSLPTGRVPVCRPRQKMVAGCWLLSRRCGSENGTVRCAFTGKN